MSDYTWKAYFSRDKPNPGGFDHGIEETHTRIENLMTPEQRRKTVRFVASKSVSSVDCSVLLEMLGLDPAEGK